MYISDPGNDGRARTMIPNGCTAVGARGSADVRVVAPTNAVIAWTNAPLPWSLCHSRVHLAVLTIPRHFTANTMMVLYSNSFSIIRTIYIERQNQFFSLLHIFNSFFLIFVITYIRYIHCFNYFFARSMLFIIIK